jgi:hypothetical protein
MPFICFLLCFQFFWSTPTVPKIQEQGTSQNSGDSDQDQQQSEIEMHTSKEKVMNSLLIVLRTSDIVM